MIICHCSEVFIKCWVPTQCQLFIWVSFSSGQMLKTALLGGQWRQAQRQKLFHIATGWLPSVKAPFPHFFLLLCVCVKNKITSNNGSTKFLTLKLLNQWGFALGETATGGHGAHLCSVPCFSVEIRMEWYRFWDVFNILDYLFHCVCHSSVLYKYWQNNCFVLLPWKGKDKEGRVYHEFRLSAGF